MIELKWDTPASSLDLSSESGIEDQYTNIALFSIKLKVLIRTSGLDDLTGLRCVQHP